jgi:N-acetylglucosamine kinase-like BadF-type ATPase
VLGALRAVARAADGRAPATPLQEHLLAALGLQHPQEMIPGLHGGRWDRAALAALAPLVLDAADAGDATAMALVNDGAAGLALAATAVATNLRLDPQRFPLAVAGGVLLASASYRERFLAALRRAGTVPDPVTLVDEPARGAVRLAATRSRPLPPRPR